MSVSSGVGQAEGALPAGGAAALAAAEIPLSKLGSARSTHLNEGERELYFWILRRFRSHGPPNRALLHDVASQLCEEPEVAFETLAHQDLVHLEAGGEIAVAYPFSGRPTTHRVHFPSGHETDAMCAIDALGVAPMFDQIIEIRSRDPLTGAPIWARVAPVGEATWEPKTAAVGVGVLDGNGVACNGDLCNGCCSALNFFASRANAERWLAEQAHVRGRTISMIDAISAGRAVFGEVFEPGPVML